MPRAIAPRPEERYATAQEFATALAAGQVRAGTTLQPQLPCRHCHGPLILDLPWCPGCGQDVAWELTPGPFAVQLLEVTSVSAILDWLKRRHAGELRLGLAATEQRLRGLPTPLLVGASAESAEQIAAQAREVGGRAEVIRARVTLGARVRPSAALPSELVGAALLHFVAFLLLAWLTVHSVQHQLTQLAVYTIILAVGGMGVARFWVRRPLLRIRPEQPVPRVTDEISAQIR